MNTKKLIFTALAIALLGSSAVFAQGNGNSNGQGARDNGNNGNGAIASELKWRNAAHASAQAFLNANPDSAVGKLATLRDAAQATADALDAAGVVPGTDIRDPADIQADIDALDVPPLTSEEVEEAIDFLLDFDQLADLSTLEEDLAAALAYEALLAELEVSESLVDVLAAEDEAADVVGLGDLSDDAFAALWDMLNN